MPRFVVQYHAEMTSTMDAAEQRARDGAPDGTVIVAGRQTRGRGRQGRDWFSPEGNMYASILLRPGLQPARLTELGFVVALAAADAVDAALPGGCASGCSTGRAAGRARLKWPNDVMIDGAKVAGILVEIIEDNAAIIGIGLNVAQAPQAVAYPVTCLSDAGATASAQEVLTHVLAALEQHVAQWTEQGFARSRAAWLVRGPAPGDAIRVRVGPRIETGRFAGLDPDGALLLDEAGALRRVIVGDVMAA